MKPNSTAICLLVAGATLILLNACQVPNTGYPIGGNNPNGGYPPNGGNQPSGGNQPTGTSQTPEISQSTIDHLKSWKLRHPGPTPPPPSTGSTIKHVDGLAGLVKGVSKVEPQPPNPPATTTTTAIDLGPFGRIPIGPKVNSGVKTIGDGVIKP